MRTTNIENYNNDAPIVRKKIKDPPKVQRRVNLMSDRDKPKLVKTIERIVRSSMEYRMYITYLRQEIDMTMCSFFTGVSNKDSKRISIEIHHEPFTLFDITLMVLEKWIILDIPLNPIMMAEEVMKLHYQNKIGLIPLSVTVHDLVHEGKVFIPLQNVYGNYVALMEEYEPYITPDLMEMLQVKLAMSQDVASQDLSILEKKYIYLEVEGMNFPQPVAS